MKAEDEKRKKFQRHRSMPENLTANLDAFTNTNSNLRHSCDELNKLNQSMLSDVDCNELEENLAATVSSTSATSSNSTVPVTSSLVITASNSSNSSVSHNTSSNHSSCIDKQMYVQLLHENERIQSYSDFIQSKLDDKNAENLRLKRNMEYLRIELSNCKDKMKKQSLPLGSSMGGGISSSLYGSHSINRLSSASSLQSVHYTPITKINRATQTEFATPVQMPQAITIFVTPDTPTAKRQNQLFGNTMQKSQVKPMVLNFSNMADATENKGLKYFGI